MSILLDRVNSAPLFNEEFSFEFRQWVSNTVDTLNEVIGDIESTLISTEVTANTVSAVDAAVNTRYIPTSAALTQYKLPVTTSQEIGSIIEIAGQGSGKWSLITNPSQPLQRIKVSSVPASASVSVAAANQFDAIRVMLVDENTWITLSSETTGFTIV